MKEYGFSLHLISRYKDNLQFWPYTGEYGSERTRIMAYFSKWYT